MAEAYFSVGLIVGTHGIRGEVKVLSKTDFPERRFKPRSELWLRKEGQDPHQSLVVRSARPHKNVWLVAFEGYQDINRVEGWRGMQLCVPESKLMPLPEGTYYIHQLVGLDVHTDDGKYVGKLVDVLMPGANDVYVVRGPLQKKDVLIPAIADVVQEVNLERGTMTVHLLPGLLDADEV
ncbi:ribosome maturation factor RimM [Alicyclobacillus contaminans]|uniref:ribosome maturation factor RimM n=1 Tax=Alicyclobacillus contaminans TaxID=392016 RepID=UPI00047DBBFD|nr:ribosome maturation factor RimM [Alicyclobacillus contaminans]GMA49074.1 ribosome maturation factor RimM [Alicyclobacillus contaminans]